MSNSNTILEAAILADKRADLAAAASLVHEADILTAISPRAALASASDWFANDAEARRWRAVAAKLRSMATT